LLLLAPDNLFGQSRYYQGAVKQLTVDDGIPDNCVDNAFIDRQGRLWVVGCNAAQIQQGLNLYMFDGYRTHPINVEIEQREEPSTLRCFGQDKAGNIYGAILNSNRILFVNPENGDQRWYKLPDTRPGEYTMYMTEHSGGFYVVTLSASNYSIYTLEEGSIRRLIDIDRDETQELPPSWLYRPSVCFNGDELWIWELWHPIYKVSLKSMQVSKYRLPDQLDVIAKPHIWVHAAQIIEAPNGELWFYHSASPNGTYVYNTSSDQIQTLDIMPAGWSPAMNSGVFYSPLFHKDEADNILLTYFDAHGNYSTTLIEPYGKKSDYSPVTDGLDHKAFRNIKSSDFRVSARTVGSKFYMIDVLANQSIESIRSPATRGISEITPDNLIVIAGEPLLLDLNKKITSPFNWPSEICEAAFVDGADMIRKEDGSLWYISRMEHEQKRLIRFDPGTNTCTDYEVDEGITRFAFISENRIVVALTSSIVLHDLDTGNSNPYSENNEPKIFDGNINAVLILKDGNIAVATTSGLWIVDPFKQLSTLIDGSTGLSDHRITSVIESRDGRIWIGTFLGGIQIYNRQTGEVQIVDQDRGLSNNAVAAMLEDNEGDIWVSTYRGITILSVEGQVIARIFKEDGLADNEGNRWSAYKITDGRLCFGSIAGVTIIDPGSAKRNFLEDPGLSIFITSAKYSSHTEGEYVTRTAFDDMSVPIVISPDDRSLELHYGLSNMKNVELNNFAYKLEGVDVEWHFVGNAHDLSLHSLPVGKYNLLLKGSDHRGIWIESPLSVPLEVKQFFFKQWWFFALFSIPVFLFVYARVSRTRKEKHRLETEVASRTIQIRAQTEQLKQMDIIKSRLYTNITHEFRTPLTVIMGLMQQLRDKKAPDWVLKSVSIVQRNSGSLLNLVNQMLDLQKLESGMMPLHMLQGDVIQFLNYLAESFRSLAESRQVYFHFLTDADTLVMDYDADKLRRIISNLLSNAIKFTPEGGSVYFQISEVNTNGKSSLALQVRDTGIGIAAEHLDKIFERFYQIDDSTTRKGEGTGIGLTLVSELVRKFDGEIQATSKVGQGTHITVHLPIHHHAPFAETPIPEIITSESVLAMGLEARSAEITIPEAKTGSALRQLLIVEDNPDVVHFLVNTLSESYHLHIAMDGQEGIDKAIEEVPDIIVSDVMMPVKDGFELCSTLKADVRTSHIPIVLLTAKADAASRLSGLQTGADAYLNKPFNKKELEVILDNLISLREALKKKYASSDHTLMTDEAESLDDRFLRDLQDVIDHNLDDSGLDVTQLCRAMNLSRTQLHRKISALTGRSTTNYVRFFRLSRAKQMLKTPGLNISEVAYQVGFRDPAYFSRSFSEEFDISPSDLTR
jgi:signal transduction histidine kinase/CheY-like chemotaxis protein/streptogramin lyase